LRRDLEEALDRGRAPGVWRRDAYALLALHVPIVTSGQARAGLAASPITLFVGSTFVVMVHTGEIRQVVRLFRHYETDDQARDETFGGGPALVLQAVVQRLLDAIGFARGRIERAIANDEELSLRGADARGARQAIATALRLRSEARQIRRATTPLPE